MTEQAHAIVEELARWIELLGVGFVIAGMVVAAGISCAGWRAVTDLGATPIRSCGPTLAVESCSA